MNRFMSLLRLPARDERGMISVIVAVSFLMLCIVGAMVMGPEFAPVAALCFGLATRS